MDQATRLATEGAKAQEPLILLDNICSLSNVCLQKNAIVFLPFVCFAPS
jgi:hypothetical protein